MASTTDFKNLSAATGIDFEKLKEKYTKSAPAEPDMFQGFKDRDAAERIQRSHKVLDQYRTCDACQGRGLVKTIYNFMVLESNCNECDSEGVIKMVDNATAKETSQATTESDGSTVAVSAEALVETTANAALTVESITTFETACEDEHEEAKAEEVLMDMVD